ncbi:MAG: peptide deformylase [Chloroflexi bacterium HGW-Chloroflexi-4]|nr:MAG: peptide deformylase [Chloroflexi bacterium HGW-Chloroflexi-4]
MAILDIISVPDLILRRKARKVTDFGKDFQMLVTNMIDTMRDAPGVGLAAPQVAISERLVVVEYADDEDDETVENEDTPAVVKKLYVLVNPEIVEKSDEMVLGIEGCLSVPELVGEVERHEKITVKALNRHGHPIKIKAEGWLARIFQHEIDHLEGIIYTDRTDKVWKPRDDEEIPLD